MFNNFIITPEPPESHDNLGEFLNKKVNYEYYSE